MQMAEKMPDAYIQLWGASLLRGMAIYCMQLLSLGLTDTYHGLFFFLDLYRVMGDHTRESESFQMHSGFTKRLLTSK